MYKEISEKALHGVLGSQESVAGQNNGGAQCRTQGGGKKPKEQGAELSLDSLHSFTAEMSVKMITPF